MEFNAAHRLRRLFRGLVGTILLVTAAAILLGAGYAHFCQRQAEVRVQCNQLFREVRAFRRERLKNPYLEQDERDALEREQWTRIIEQSGQSRSPSAIQSPNSDLFQFSGAKTADPDTHWAYQRLRRTEPPEVSNRAWIRNPIDQFVLARLEGQGLEPAEEAAPRLLARRVWFDLIGLPPSPEEMDGFLADRPSPKYEWTVQELMDRPAFGERWARTWLDVARYADSNGYEEDEIRPHAYAFRDFVIWAMNQDLPYDQFVRWQIAGDEIDAANPLAVAATGFLTAGPYNTFLPQPSERRDELDDMVSTIGAAMLGTTVGCARCHDHMYDPISIEEYYGLVAILADTSRQHRYLAPDGGQEYIPIDRNLAEMREIRRARVTEEKIAALDDFTEEEKDLLRKPIDPNNKQQALLLARCSRCRLVMDHELSGEIEPLPRDEQRYRNLAAANERLASRLPPPPPKGLTISGSQVTTMEVLYGGQPGENNEQVGPGFLNSLTPGVAGWESGIWRNWALPGEEAKPRTALANWLTDVEAGAGPLLARVMVNRLWQHHFGAGLVATPNDFGLQGDEPEHPELLEWLAGELVRKNWSLKHIHRLIVTSATYRQAGELAEQPDTLAGRHTGLFRRPPQRLTAEMIRDAMLSVSGNLNTTLYGPAVFVPIPRDAVYNKEEQENLMWPEHVPEREAILRRSIYVLLKRTNPVPLFQLFDGPEGSMSCGHRSVTTVPTQALAMLNSDFVRQQSQRLAGHVFDVSLTEFELVEAVFKHALSRPPTQAERELGVQFLSHAGLDEELESALADFCQVVLMSNEFIYVD